MNVSILEKRIEATRFRVFLILSIHRELRAYVKEGLRMVQSSCLPLRTCSLLVSLAKAQLLCDDDEQAQVS